MDTELKKIDWTGYQSYTSTLSRYEIAERVENHIALGLSLLGVPCYDEFSDRVTQLIFEYRANVRDLEFRLYQNLILFLVFGGQLEYNRETAQWDFVLFEIPGQFLDEGTETLVSNL